MIHLPLHPASKGIKHEEATLIKMLKVLLIKRFAVFLLKKNLKKDLVK